MPKEVRSIIECLNTDTGERRELLRLEGRYEAPFFRGAEEMLFNGGGRIYRYFLFAGQCGLYRGRSER